MCDCERGCKDDERVLCVSERKSSEGVFELVCEMNESASCAKCVVYDEIEDL